MNAAKDSKLITMFFIVLILTVIFQLAGLYFSTSQSGGDFQSVIIPSTIALSFFTLITAGPGLYAGQKLGLGTPRLYDLVQLKSGVWRDLGGDVKRAIPIGLAAGTLLVGLRYVLADYMPAELPEFGFRGFWGGALISLSAAIGEEVWFRLGIMTLLVWAASKILNYKDHEPIIVWTVLILVSVIFAMAHLPHLASQGAAEPIAIAGTLFGNVAVGLLYGWFYWKRGLVCAILAHFSVDIAIHAIPALV